VTTVYIVLNDGKLYKKKRTFLCKYIGSSSVLCRLFASTAAGEYGKVQSV